MLNSADENEYVTKNGSLQSILDRILWKNILEKNVWKIKCWQ